MSKQPNSQTLPPKELSVFKRIVKYYDQKQFKNGLKYTKQILGNPKFAEHGETLAMKGILLNCVGKKDEARDFVKRGLKANISSFVCWHIYGLIQKSDRKYDEAIKCYLQALRLDTENIQVLRDLSVLQMQLRNYEGCKDTRYKLLMLRPSQRASWIGYAVVLHLLGDHETALTILTEFKKGQGDAAPGYETSELILYQGMIMTEARKHEDALRHLDELNKEVVDVDSLLGLKVQQYIHLNKLDEAKEFSWKLIDRNQENQSSFDLLCKAHGSESANDKDCLKIKRDVYSELLQRYPRSRLAKRLILGVLEGEQFVKQLDEYLKHHLRKGAPPLFIQLKSLWSKPENLKILEDLINGYRLNMEKLQSLQSSPIEVEPPSTNVWLDYLEAQFLSFTGRYQEALKVIDLQLVAAPTIVDFYVLKAEVYYTAGDVITASRWMEEAQSLDTADRYINAQCTKYMVQALRLEDAVAMASKFTRGNTSAADYLSEMQCMWFLIDNARSLKKLGKYGEALKLCREIEQHYQNILDDQLDFHSYCLRKGTLRSYIETLRLEDGLRDHPSYLDTAILAIEIYMHLLVRPLGADNDADGEGQNDISTSEAKKLRNKQRRAARRAEAEAAKTRAEQERREQALRSRQPATEEPDPERQFNANTGLDPNALARPKDALEEACNFLRPLLELAPTRLNLHCLAYELYERKNKWLIMLRSIKRGMKIPGSADDPQFHECCVRFLCKLKQCAATMKSEPDSLIYRVLETEVPKIFPGWLQSADSLPGAFNEAFLKRNAHSFPHVFRATLLKCLTGSDDRAKCLSQLPRPDNDLEGITWEACENAMELLKTAYTGPIGEVDSSVIDAFRLACSNHFPMTNAFRTESELTELRSEMVAAGTATSVSGLFTAYNDANVTIEESASGTPSKLADNLKDMKLSGTMVNGDTTCTNPTVSNKLPPSKLNKKSCPAGTKPQTLSNDHRPNKTATKAL